MSAIATASAPGERLGERVEQRRGPVVGQRLVDGPHAPAGLALADRRERLADRRRVVAVVVVDHDARPPRPCARAAARRRRTRPAPRRRRRRQRRRAAAAPATPSAFAALWRPAVGSRTGRGPASGSRPAISSVVASGSLGRDPAEQRVGRTRRAAEPLGDAPGEAAQPLRRRVDERRREDPPRPVRRAGRRARRRRRRRRSRRGTAWLRRTHRRHPPPAGSTPRRRPAPRRGRRTRRGGPTRRR